MKAGSVPHDSPLHLAGQTWKVLVGLALFAGTIDLLNHLIALALGVEVSFWWTVLRIVVWWMSYIPLLACALVLADRYRLDGPRPRAHLAIHFVAALGFAYVHTTSNAFLDPQWLKGDANPVPGFFRTVRINFPIDFVSYWAIVGATYALHYYSEAHRRELAAEQLKTTTAQLEASLADARLRALRSQLNPHFLFNTLNAVSALALKGQPKTVARTLSRLSGLLRVSLDNEGPPLTPLANELQFLEGYIEIQRLLCGERLVIDRTIAAETLAALVPAMILQPLVENAFVHGIAQSAGPARLGIEAAREEDTLRLTITDSGAGFNAAPASRIGIGLSNTDARLRQLFGADYDLECGQLPQGGASVTIRLPFLRSLADAASA